MLIVPSTLCLKCAANIKRNVVKTEKKILVDQERCQRIKIEKFALGFGL